MKRFALLLLLAIPAAGQITDYESCQQKACFGFRPPTGAAQNGMLWHDLSFNPPRLYCGYNGTWALCGSSGSGVNSIQQYYLGIATTPGTGSVLGQPTTAMNGLVPMLNGIRNVQLYCNTSGTLDNSCISNALLANTVLNVPAGTYNLNSVVNVTQSGVTFQCAPGAIFVQNNATQGFNITGNNVVFDGCTINTNGNGNQVIEVSAVTGFTFRNSSVVNATAAGNYGVRIDHSSNVILKNNYCNAPSSNCAQSFDSSVIAVQDNYGIGHIGIASSSGAPAAGNTITVTGNNVAPSKGQFAIEIGDFSGGNYPIDNLTFNGNSCRITTASASANAVNGCYSIVAHVNKCSISNNTVQAISQWFNAPPFEIGVDDCPIIGNSIYTTDTNNEGYNGLTLYGGGNTVIGNKIRGWGATGDGIQLYCQTPGGTSHTCDNNLFSGNIIIGHNQTNGGGITGAFGIQLQCNIPGSSAMNQKLVGNLVTTDAGTIARGINIEDDHPGPPDTCPMSAFIDNHTNQNVTRDLQTANSNPLSLGKIDSTNATLQIFNGGTTTQTNVQIPSTINANGFVPTTLTPSVQSLCYPTAGSPLTNSGCAAINAGQVTFTPTAIGWYRIINSGGGTDRGYFDTWSTYGFTNYPATRVTFSLQGGGTNELKVDNLGLYGGNYGAIDQVRASTDSGTGATYLDIHISTISGVAPITIAFYGLAVPSGDIVTNPVVGATAGALNVALANYNLFNTNSLFPSVTTFETGEHIAADFTATDAGFSINHNAPSGNCLVGNGRNYVDSGARCPQNIAWGTIALPTTAVAANSCTAGTTSTTGGAVANVGNADTVTWSPDGDPTAIGGYAPFASGYLIIYVYPGTGSVTAKVCNATASPITPSLLTLNWRVVR